MLRIRRAEEAIGERYAEQEMRCPCHLAIGQEAVAAGACAALRPRDVLFGTYRGHGLYLARGGSLPALIAELYGKAGGCTRGRGGSMQLVAPEVGLVCTSAIVGGTLPMAVGAALSASVRRTGQVALAVFGDGATEEGVFHESLNFAALKRLPVVFICENNLYACYTHQRERQPADNIFQRAAAYAMPGRRIDGNDVQAVYRAAADAIGRARRGGGPSLIECRTYRWREHVGPADDTPLGYRPASEVRAWQARCPVAREERRLLRSGGLTPRRRDSMARKIAEELDAAFAAARRSPFPAPSDTLNHVYAPADAARFGAPVPESGPERSYCEAINEALHQAMARDPAIVVMGEGVTDPRAIFGSTRGLRDAFGAARVFETPLSENGMTGVAVGAALTGLRPLMTHQRVDFMLYAMDQLVNHAAKRCYASGGTQSVPMVIRAVVGRGWGQGAQHSQSLQALFAHVPGLKVIMPTTPYDAKGLLLGALADGNPVICLEYRSLYDQRGPVPSEPYTLPLGTGAVRRRGTEVTVVAVSAMVLDALQAAEEAGRAGISVEVLDLRTVKPWDQALVLSSVERTGRVVVADTGWACCGLSAEIAAVIAERAFPALKAPVRRVALPDAPTPTSAALEAAFYPGVPALVNAIWSAMERTRPGPADVAADAQAGSLAGQPVFVGPF